MRKLVKIAVVLLIILSAGSTSVAYGRTRLTDAEKLEKGWIVRDISYGMDDSIVIVDVKAIINSSPAKIWGFLTDIGHWATWMPAIIRGWVIRDEVLNTMDERPEKVKDVYSKVLESTPDDIAIRDAGKTEVSTFEEFDLPWPIKNDWVIRRYIFDSAYSDEGEYSVEWKQMFKGAEGRGGRWKLSKYNGKENETVFEYHFRVKRKEGVPKVLFEALVGKTADRFINAIKRNVESS